MKMSLRSCYFILKLLIFSVTINNTNASIPVPYALLNSFKSAFDYVLLSLNTTNLLVVGTGILPEEYGKIVQTVTPTTLVDTSKPFNKFDSIKWVFNLNFIIVDKSEDLVSSCTKLLRYSFLNRRGKYFVLHLSNEPVEKLVKALWTQHIINVIIVKQYEQTIKLISYYPYDKGDCGTNLTIKIYTKEELLNSVQLFPRKIPEIFNGCKVRSWVTVQEPFTTNYNITSDSAIEAGFENVLVKNLLKRFNLREEVVQEGLMSYIITMVNDTWFGPYQSLMEMETDLAYGHMWLSNFKNTYFDHSHVFLLDDFSIVVPAAKLQKPWKKLIIVFTPTIWIIMAVALVMYICSWWALDRSNSRRKEYSWYALHAWYAFLCGSIPVRRSIKHYIVVFWTLYSLLICTSYQSQLLSVLTRPIYEDQISTMQELLNSPIRYIYTNSTLERYVNSNLPYMDVLLKEGIYKTMPEYVEMRRNPIPNTAYEASTLITKQMFKEHFLYPDNQPKVAMIPRSGNHFYVCFFMRKGHPAMEKFNSVILWYIQSGLLNKWIKDCTPAFDQPEVRISKLSLYHFMSAFTLFFTGTFISALVFSFEIIIYKFNMWRSCHSIPRNINN